MLWSQSHRIAQKLNISSCDFKASKVSLSGRRLRNEGTLVIHLYFDSTLQTAGYLSQFNGLV